MMRVNEGCRPCPICGSEAIEHIYEQDGFDLSQCCACRLAYISNPPDPEELSLLYSFESNYHTKFVDNQRIIDKYRRIARFHYNIIEQYVSKGRLLDLGCSVGFFMQEALRHDWEVSGIELSSDTANIAIERYGLDVKIGRLEDLSLEDNSYDLITMWDFIEHVFNPRQTLQTVHKLLSDDGLIVLSTPNLDGLVAKLSYKLMTVVGHWPHPEPPYHLSQFSKNTIINLLERTGFDIVAIKDNRIPLLYTLSSYKKLLPNAVRLLCAMLIIPIIFAAHAISPLIKQGDSLIIIAKKKKLY